MCVVSPLFSIVVCSNRPERAAVVRDHYASLFRDHPHEILLIEDAVSLCEGYARGVRRSRGRYLVFSHDDVELVTPDAAGRLEQHLSQWDVVGIAGTTRLIDGAWGTIGDPYCFALVIYPEADGLYAVKCIGAGPLCVSAVQAFDGCFFACRREVAETVGFDEVTFDGFHLYDVDFTFASYLAGFRQAVCRDIALIHASLGTYNDAWRRYKERFERKYAGRLAPGTPGPTRELRARLPKEKLAWFCEPSALEKLIGRLAQPAEAAAGAQTR